MGIETLIVFLTCGFILLIIILGSWCRRKKLAEKESAPASAEIIRIHEAVINGRRTFRIATVTRQADRLALEVYEIRLPRIDDPTNRTATIRVLPQPTAQNRNSSSARQELPPPFSTAISMPSPYFYDENIPVSYAENVEEELPPRYDRIVTPISTISGNKVQEDSASVAPLPGTMLSIT